MKSKKNNGFASMDPKIQREIAKKGGKAVSMNREHMAAIGRLGGERSGEVRGKKKDIQKPEDDGVQ